MLNFLANILQHREVGISGVKLVWPIWNCCLAASQSIYIAVEGFSFWPWCQPLQDGYMLISIVLKQGNQIVERMKKNP